MAEERPTTEDRILAAITRLDEKFEGRFDSLEQRMARLEGGFEQMDRRVSTVEGTLRELVRDIRSMHRWMVGLIVTTWLTVTGLIIAVLSRLP